PCFLVADTTSAADHFILRGLDNIKRLTWLKRYLLYLSNIIIYNKKHPIALRSRLLNYDSSGLVEPGPSKILKKQYLTSAVFPFNIFHCCFFSSKYLLIKTATSVRRFLLYRKQFKLQE